MDQVSFLKELNSLSENTLMRCLQINYTSYTGDSLVAEMPVNNNTVQPFGILHGGASVALAESVGSTLSYLSVNNEIYTAVGIQITANHLLSVKEGVVKAVARITHKGNSIHVVDIQITDNKERLIAICRLTNKIIRKDE